MKTITKEWIKKAEEDYKVALREFKAIPLPCSTVCFHCQQAIEKYMKAILQENNTPFAKIHDLDGLLNDCKKFIPQLKVLREELIWLTAFAVGVRYPGYIAQHKDALKAVGSMKKAARVLRKYFKDRSI